eukprot:358514-Chlamydomonas_euryale.AAC.13
MPACRPAARGQTRRHTVAALAAGGETPPSPLSMARLPLGMKGGRPNRISSVQWNSVAPFLAWTAAPHCALALWNGPHMLRGGLNMSQLSQKAVVDQRLSINHVVRKGSSLTSVGEVGNYHATVQAQFRLRGHVTAANTVCRW